MKAASKTATALLLIDIQKGFEHPTHWGLERSTPSLEANVEKLLEASRKYNNLQDKHGYPVQIIHVHHHSTSAESPLHPSKPSAEPMAFCSPKDGELVLTKAYNSAFVGTDLEAILRANHIRQLVVVGLTSDHCVSTTTRMGANLQVLGMDGGVDGSGKDNHGIVLVRDALAAHSKGGFDAETVHAVHLASLEGEFAQVTNTTEVIDIIIQ